MFSLMTHLTHILLASLSLLCGTLDTTSGSSLESTLARHVSELYDSIDQERQAKNIPGLAIAIVRQDQVIALRGFGTANLNSGAAVTPDTTFPIASTSKTMTGTLIALLEGNGVLDWDDPVSQHLPSFALPIKGNEPTQEVTLRDLASHRTGLSPMPLRWLFHPAPSRDSLLENAAQHARPLHDFRQRFLYNNVMFTAAGVAATRAAGADRYESLIKTRLFEPLGMTNTSVWSAEDPTPARLATGYWWSTVADESWSHP